MGYFDGITEKQDLCSVSMISFVSDHCKEKGMHLGKMNIQWPVKKAASLKRPFIVAPMGIEPISKV